MTRRRAPKEGEKTSPLLFSPSSSEDRQMDGGAVRRRGQDEDCEGGADRSAADMQRAQRRADPTVNIQQWGDQMTAAEWQIQLQGSTALTWRLGRAGPTERQRWAARRARHNAVDEQVGRGRANGTTAALSKQSRLVHVCCNAECTALVFRTARSRAERRGTGNGCASDICSRVHRRTRFVAKQYASARNLEEGCLWLVERAAAGEDIWIEGCARVIGAAAEGARAAARRAEMRGKGST